MSPELSTNKNPFDNPINQNNLKKAHIQVFNNPDNIVIELRAYTTRHRTNGSDKYLFELHKNHNPQSLEDHFKAYKSTSNPEHSDLLYDEICKVKDQSPTGSYYGLCRRAGSRNHFFSHCYASFGEDQEQYVINLFIYEKRFTYYITKQAFDQYQIKEGEKGQSVINHSWPQYTLYQDHFIKGRMEDIIPVGKPSSKPKTKSEPAIVEPTFKEIVQNHHKNEQDTSITEVDRQDQDQMNSLKELIKSKVKELMPIVPSYHKDTRFDYLLKRAMNSHIWKTTNDPEATINEMIMEAKASSY